MRRQAPAGRETHRIADRLHSAAIHLLRGVRRADRETGLSPQRLSALSVVVFAVAFTFALVWVRLIMRATILERPQ